MNCIHLDCTDAMTELNAENEKKRSLLYMSTPIEKVKRTKLYIFAGIYEGIQGSVPVTHSINFYNKLLSDLRVKANTKYVSDKEKLDLLEYRRPPGRFGAIGGRKICLRKRYGNLQLALFEGEHEMLTAYVFNEILKD